MNAQYGAQSFKHLKGLEAVRVRPGMYLGSVGDGTALHHCVWEAVDNSVDEHLAGHATKIRVNLKADRWISVWDNGRGIPVDIHPEEGVSALEMALTQLHAGTKFSDETYAFSAGLHGVGISAVNAVSSMLVAKVRRGGVEYKQEYSCGVPTTRVEAVGSAVDTGTEISWRIDETIFSGVLDYDDKILVARLQELAFLNPGLEITFLDERKAKPSAVVFSYTQGVKEYVEDLVAKKAPVMPVLHVQEFGARSGVELALTWVNSSAEDVRCFANNTRNRDGGTHLTGFRNGITKVIMAYAKDHDLLKGLEEGLTGDDIRAGLVAVVSVRIPDISFSSQTKDKLVTAGARKLVEDVTADRLLAFMEKNPGISRKLVDHAVLNAKAREAARRARDGVLRKTTMDALSLPGKLADCQSKKPEECELYLVEGESAGGSAKGGRDRRFQAILPLRGKILNVEKATLDSVLENAELGTLMSVIGCGTEAQGNFDITKLRYHKIVIMTDADIDGAHIRTLLLTFFFRYTPQLILGGFLYIAVPPLYRVKKGHYERFFLDEAAYHEYVAANPNHAAHTTRYKGLGEMNPETLWETTMNPENRILKQVTIEDALDAEDVFCLLMGDSVEARREFIEKNALSVQHLDV